MSPDWGDFAAPRNVDPLTYRGGESIATYPVPQGAATPPGWNLGEWVVDFEETPLYERYEEHKAENMELTILVSDYHARRGTGKTTLSIHLAREFDDTEEGLTPDKVTNSAEEFIDAYVQHGQGSGLIFDEAEAGINARNAMTKVNKELNEKVSMGRVGEKYAVWNMPDVGQIDKQMRTLAHLWVLVTRKGRCRVYELNNNPFEGQTYPTPICEIEWSRIDHDDPVYKALDEHKWEKLEGEGEEYVTIDEHQERVEKAKKEAEMEKRNEFITKTYGNDLLPAKEVGHVVGLSDRRVRQIAKENGEEEAVSA